MSSLFWVNVSTSTNARGWQREGINDGKLGLQQEDSLQDKPQAEANSAVRLIKFQLKVFLFSFQDGLCSFLKYLDWISIVFESFCASPLPHDPSGDFTLCPQRMFEIFEIKRTRRLIKFWAHFWWLFFFSAWTEWHWVPDPFEPPLVEGDKSDDKWVWICQVCVLPFSLFHHLLHFTKHGGNRTYCFLGWLISIF